MVCWDTETLHKLSGRTVTAVYKTDSQMEFVLSDGGRLAYSCEGACCANAYFYQCENLEWLIGKPVLSVERRDLPSTDSDYQQVDYEMWSISTASGTATIEMRTEHNGYYCGYVVNSSPIPLGESARVA